MLEYSLPDLALRRRLTSRQLTGRPLAEPEGLVCANGCLYVAWLQDVAVSATPLEALEVAAAAHGPAPPRQRVVRGPPGQAQWIFWGMRPGPDGALYVAANPPYAHATEAGAYGDLPPETGRGFVARLALNAQGELGGSAPCAWAGSACMAGAWAWLGWCWEEPQPAPLTGTPSRPAARPDAALHTRRASVAPQRPVLRRCRGIVCHPHGLQGAVQLPA